MAAKHCQHASCPVPSGIIKAIEVASGLALPKDGVFITGMRSVIYDQGKRTLGGLTFVVFFWIRRGA
jgi:hypothetical protein